MDDCAVVLYLFIDAVIAYANRIVRMSSVIADGDLRIGLLTDTITFTRVHGNGVVCHVGDINGRGCVITPNGYTVATAGIVIGLIYSAIGLDVNIVMDQREVMLLFDRFQP